MYFILKPNGLKLIFLLMHISIGCFTIKYSKTSFCINRAIIDNH